jgi:hypothetical protein
VDFRQNFQISNANYWKIQMNQSACVNCALDLANQRPHLFNKLLLYVAVLLATLNATAQTGMPSVADLQEKMIAVKQSLAENQEKLHHYEWTETMQITLKGDPKPSRQFLCRYAPDGTVQKTPIGVEQQQGGGRLRQRIVQKKKEELQDYMAQVKNLLAMYVPPDPQKIGQSFQAGNASLSPNPGSQTLEIGFKNYAQSGDQMTVSFDTSAKKVSGLKVNTYMDDPKNVVTLAVEMSSLPDSTNYVQRSVLDATAKKLQVTTISSDYQRLGGQ